MYIGYNKHKHTTPSGSNNIAQRNYNYLNPSDSLLKTITMDNNFSKKFTRTSLLMGAGIGIFAIAMIYFIMKISPANNDNFILKILGNSFWYIVIGFVVFTLLLIYVLQRWILGGLKVKDIPNGLPATATVIKSYQAGMSMRAGAHQFYSIVIEVNVRNPQGETWPAKIEQMLPVTEVGLFQPGVSFAVKYDPNNKNKVVIDQSEKTQQQFQQPFNNSYIIPGFGTVNSQMAQQAMQSQPQDIVLQLQAFKSLLESLKKIGISATATVLSREIVYENFMQGVDAIKIRFKVDKNNYETEEVLITPKTSLYKCDPGKTIYVLYDPNNPKRVGISGLDKPDGIVAL